MTFFLSLLEQLDFLSLENDSHFRFMYSVLAVLLFCSSIPVFPVNWKLNIESWLDSGLFSIGTFHRGALYFPFDHIRKHIFYVFNRNILWQIVYLKGYIWNLEKWYWWTNLQGRNRDADIENRRLDIQGKERVGWFERVALRHIFYHMWDRDDWDDCVPCAKSFQSSPTLCGLQPARLLCPWNSPGKNTGVGCHFLLQGIFPT